MAQPFVTSGRSVLEPVCTSCIILEIPFGPTSGAEMTQCSFSQRYQGSVGCDDSHQLLLVSSYIMLTRIKYL